jgi:hypothetical protein
MCHRNPLATLPEDPLIANKARDERGTVPDTGMSGPPAFRSKLSDLGRELQRIALQLNRMPCHGAAQPYGIGGREAREAAQNR